MKPRFARGFVFALAGLAMLALFGAAVLYLWNAVVPDVFGLHPITFWQALGMLTLSWILFGGAGMFRGGKGHCGMRHRMTSDMTPEEREKFRQTLLERCARRKGPESPA